MLGHNVPSNLRITVKIAPCASKDHLIVNLASSQQRLVNHRPELALRGPFSGRIGIVLIVQG